MGRLLEKLIKAPEVMSLLREEHFSVDGTLLQAWVSHASRERIDGQELPRPCAHGQPPSPDRGLHGDASHGHRGAGCRQRNGG
jgi:hypothetical protein